jgi:polyferredoxin
MFVIVASSVYYGRVYCGYLCPQMIFSEASTALQNRIRRWVTRRFVSARPAVRSALNGAIFYTILGLASVFLAFVFISYFVEPLDLIRRLASFDVRTAGGISGAAVTLVTFLDFALVRQRFCTTVCPYGYLQGILGDGNTLLVHYRDPGHACIECKKCVRVCEMGIDIRNSPHQIECIHCGECIDACNEVLARLKKPGLIFYTWGETGEHLGERSPWYQRIGIRDAKRVVVLLVLAFYASGLFVALAMRRPVLVRVMPERGGRLYRVDGGRVYNQFRYSIANRGHLPAVVIFSARQLPGATLSPGVNPVSVAPGGSLAGEFEISVPAGRRADMVSHFTIDAATVPEQGSDTIPMTFLTPPEKTTP